MPTLFRFLVVVLVLAGLAGAGMIYLANFVKPHTRELSVRIPAEKLVPQQLPEPPAPPPEAEPSAPPEAEPPAAPNEPIQPPKQPE